ncbi:Putative restriction endonuclease domain-containing protein [Tumidithrix helvetica PCC 7403]|uniref:Uma2 family endonuclease n=1 Tax=Tumidithrix helvetica TaxID=3457545 RepID=UPI003CB69C9B
MVIAVSKSLTLEGFLQLPETKPVQEYINGEIITKPMPKGRHSRLQGKLCSVINQVTEAEKIAYAFPELRCTFGGSSIVPDVAVFLWQQILFNENGEVPDDFKAPPDWTIEVLSPEQKSNKAIGNILNCLNHGCQLGWFVEPDDYSILAFLPGKQPQLLRGSDRLPVLASIQLDLTVSEVFNWLKMS